MVSNRRGARDPKRNKGYKKLYNLVSFSACNLLSAQHRQTIQYVNLARCEILPDLKRYNRASRLAFI